MQYTVTSFKVEIRFKEGRAEFIDVCNLRTAIERQVKVSLSEDLVYVLPLDPITREVVECDFCNEIEDVPEQRSAVWGKDTEDENNYEHVCTACLNKHPELKEAA